jgi:hypothetical protein
MLATQLSDLAQNGDKTSRAAKPGISVFAMRYPKVTAEDWFLAACRSSNDILKSEVLLRELDKLIGRVSGCKIKLRISSNSDQISSSFQMDDPAFVALVDDLVLTQDHHDDQCFGIHSNS